LTQRKQKELLAQREQKERLPQREQTCKMIEFKMQFAKRFLTDKKALVKKITVKQGKPR